MGRTGSPTLSPNRTSERLESHVEADPVHKHISPARKWVIAAILSLGGFNSNLASQIVSPAIPEIATAFQTTGEIVNLNNALYILFMGLGSLFWGPICTIYGKRWVAIIASTVFLGSVIGTGFSPNLAAFFIFRILSAVTGTAFQVIGPSCISDIYSPMERGNILSWFLTGTLLAPSLGPFIGGVIITYTDWKALFWFLAGLVGLCSLLVIMILPETSQKTLMKHINNLKGTEKLIKIIQLGNPVKALSLFRSPKLILLGFATSSIIWNMQSLLTPVRYVINPRFKLTSPLLSGLFYLASGAGYLAGAVIGGFYTDRVVRSWARKRGRIVPEDRLRGSFVAMGIGIPASIAIYGWCIDQAKGGIPVPVICMFAQGLAQLVCLPCLNIYCLEVIEGKGNDVMAGNLFVRYSVAAVGTALCLPGINAMGVGWWSTISAIFVAASSFGIFCILYFDLQ
ncbi:unnamed protein product [Clonostachys solani]|uniref:Major facilitator superfamily (MFS) profile domain-containing protein n=1 Tax=Clonostachys solani TaxID=160281 RepID=A0A9N9W8A6_9HYPO|nr:unnamed protein product [Clonostachys solani]